MTKFTAADIRKKSYYEDKRVTDFYFHPFAYYVNRPLSFHLTAVFLRFNITAINATFLGGIFLVLGWLLLVSSFGNQILIILGAVFLNAWYLLDYVDGNIARYRNETSEYGAVLDTAIGHLNHIISPVAVGIAAYYYPDRGGIELLLLGCGISIFSASRTALGKISRQNRPRVSDRQRAEKTGRIGHLGYALQSTHLPALLLAAIAGLLIYWLLFYFLFAFLTWAKKVADILRKGDRGTS